MKRLIMAVLLPVLLLAFPITSHAVSEEEELFSASQQAFDDGFHDVAIRYLEEFLPKFPLSPKMDQVKLLLGQCYFLKNEFKKALDTLQSIPAIKDNRDAYLFWTGEAHLKVPNYNEARLFYQQLIDLYPDSVYVPQAMYSLAWSYFDQKQYFQAKEAFGKLLARFPKHPLAEDSTLKIAESTYNKGDYPAAVKEFEQYFQKYAQSTHGADVYLNVADAYYYIEDYTQAFDAYDKALKLAEDDKTAQLAYIGKVWCLIKKKTYDQAQKTIKEGVEFSNGKNLSIEDLLLAQGHLFYEKGDWESAGNAYRDLIKNFPSGSHRLEAYLGRGNANYALKNFPAAMQDFKFIIDHQKPGVNKELVEKASLGLGWVFVKLNEIDEAIKCFKFVHRNATRRDSKMNALVQIADAYHDAGRLDEAIATYGEVLKAYAKGPWVDYTQYRMGIALLKSEKIESALTTFWHLQTNFPKSKYLEDINYYLGVAQFKKSNWTAAAQRMEEFLKGLTKPSDFAPEANYILALSYLNMKQSEEALKIFQKILRLYPGDELVAKNSDIGIAKCLFELGQGKEAVKRFKLIAFKYPKTDVEQEALLWLAQYSMKNSEYVQATEYYVRILERFPDNPQNDQIHYELGQAYELQGSPDQALTQYKTVSEKDASLLAKVKLAIAGIFSKEFDPQKALNAYENIAATDPDYARDAYLKMAQIYRNSQNYAKEIEIYQKALNINRSKAVTSNAELLFNIGDAYEAMSKSEEAVDYYLKIPAQYSDQTPWIVKAYLRVANIFEERKDMEGAEVTYRKIISLNTEESKYAQERLDMIKKK